MRLSEGIHVVNIAPVNADDEEGTVSEIQIDPDEAQQAALEGKETDSSDQDELAQSQTQE